MIRIVTMAAVCATFLSACTNLPEWVANSGFAGRSHDADVGHYRFDWQLSGERQVAPLQVFDNGKQTWLQFLPAQPVPAIFQQTTDGERPLAYTRQADYLILNGVWPELSFRGGLLHATAKKSSVVVSGVDPVAPVLPDTEVLSDTDSQVHPAVEPLPESLPEPVAEPVMLAQSLTDLTSGDSNIPVNSARQSDSLDNIRKDVTNPFEDVGILTKASFDRSIRAKGQQPYPAQSQSARQADAVFTIRLQDQNLRKALHRWAAQAQWTFAPEHWDIDVDIAISGEADFFGSFQDAVQEALSATELADRPLRPCFYSNRVLRVVSYTRSCDRSGTGSGVRSS